MKMNSLMARRWSQVARTYETAVLHPALAELAGSPLIELDGAVILKGLYNSRRGRPDLEDLTGFEAHANKIHIEDFTGAEIHQDERLLQGMKYAEALHVRLKADGRPFRLILSRDPDSDAVVVLFCVRRPSQPWSPDDVEECKLEELTQWDT